MPQAQFLSVIGTNSNNGLFTLLRLLEEKENMAFILPGPDHWVPFGFFLAPWLFPVYYDQIGKKRKLHSCPNESLFHQKEVLSL